MSFYCASRLPFAKPQTRLQLNHGPNATPATAISPRQTLCTSKQSLTPCQFRFMALQGQVPEAVPVSFYGASRLPFASPQTRLQLDYRPNATSATAISPRQTLCTSKQSLRPCQCHFIALQGCRLPSLKRACSSITAQTPLLPQQSLRGRPCALPSSP